MLDDDHHLVPRVPLARPDRTFGRRGSLPDSGTQRPRPQRGTRPMQARSASPPPLIARYTWRVSLVGVSVLSLAGKLLHMTTWTQSTGGVTAAGGGSVTMVGGLPDINIAIAVAVIIGIAWIAQGLTRARALRIDATGVIGFTLLGTRHFAWADIALVKVDWHPIYKQQMTIHATVGSATGGWGIISPTMIPVMTGKTDKTLADILAAIRQHRPDLPIERSPMLDRLVQFFSWYSKEWASHHR
jgi:hypothetical protein